MIEDSNIAMSLYDITKTSLSPGSPHTPAVLQPMAKNSFQHPSMQPWVVLTCLGPPVQLPQGQWLPLELSSQ